MRIGVIGAGFCEKEIYQAAEKVGSWIGKKNHVLVCGGLGGVMEAAAKGAKAEGGVTIGILPGFDASEANSFIDYPIVTGLSHARNVIIARTADILISISGEYGTLSEIAFGLKMDKPVIAYKSKWKEIERVFYADGINELFSKVEEIEKRLNIS